METTLYKRDKNNTIRIWSIKTSDNVMYVKYGTKGGEIISKKQIILKGKNIGKKNETTPEQQVILEAKSKIKKKKDQGYTHTEETVCMFKSPMLSHVYDDFSHKIIFPCYVQPKLDGYRMLYDGVDMLTRNNKKYNVLYGSELHEELKSLKTDFILDGELYVHDKNYCFENYGVLRKKKLNKDDSIGKIKFHVFDLINEEPFEDRYKKLDVLEKCYHVVKVPLHQCMTKEDIDKYHVKFIEQGYEGTMVRNKKSKYINSRSYDLLKYKNFEDSEFKIVGFNYEKNLSDDDLKPVVWKCITESGSTFDVQSKGTREERDFLYKKAKDYIGKYITVKFFGHTEQGIPRFPKTLREGLSGFSDKSIASQLK